MRRPRLVLLVALALAGPAPSKAEPLSASTAAVRIGYSHGGRTNLLYRTYTHGCFDAAGVGVSLYTLMTVRAKEFERIPPDAWIDGGSAGKATGVQIADRIADGEFDGGVVGEASFLDALERGKPLVAVALLGHQSADRPEYALVLRNGVKIERPEDFKGKTLLSRRAGPMDEAVLREFVLKQGLDPGKDVRLLPQVRADEAKSLLMDGKADGGLLHLLAAKKLIERKAAYIYRPMDWVNPEMMQALLVFNADYLKRFPGKVQKVVDAYVDRIAYERGLPEEAKNRSDIKGLLMREDYQGLSMPTYDLPPRVRLELLQEAQRLLLRHGALRKAVEIPPAVDNGFVERAAARPAAVPAAACSAHPRLPFQNAIVIGWGGARRSRLRDLIGQGKLPNLARLISKGILADLDSPPEWTDARTLIEAGAVTERLKARFGGEIAAASLSGRSPDLEEKVSASLRSLSGKRFFFFVRSEDPAETGSEDAGSLLALDDRLGRIMRDLEDRKLDEQTLIYVVSDRAPAFLATNDPAVARARADRLDVAPTLLDRFGVDPSSGKPPLNGRSMLDGR